MTSNDKRGFTIRFDIAIFITGVIVVAWAATYVAEFISPTFEAPASLDPLMLLVSSAYITKTTVQKRDSNTSETEEADDVE